MINRLRQQPADAVALIDDDAGGQITFAELLKAVDAFCKVLKSVPRPATAFIQCGNTGGSVVAYLACLSKNIPLCLCEPRSLPFKKCLECYKPTLVILPEGAELPVGYENFFQFPSLKLLIFFRSSAYPVAPHPDLALLLPTSGSTGNQKLVRLTQRNLVSNAESIIDYLQLGVGERSIQGLPIHYSYGLSLLNSHLLCGGVTVLTSHSFMRPEFWECFRRNACTSFAGVPFMYEVLHRLRINPAHEESLSYFTQAGGALKPSLVNHYAQAAAEGGKRFYVMYGQTEATARISYLSPSDVCKRPGSIGRAIPGGSLSLKPTDDGATELIYEGPNVMMGYASSPEDLEKGDELNGVLRTGDLARVDEDGYFYVTGRLNRFAKLFGKRISLQDVESFAAAQTSAPAAAVEHDGKLLVFIESASAPAAELRNSLARELATPPPTITVRNIEFLPRTASGKVDFNALQSLASNATSEQRPGVR